MDKLPRNPKEFRRKLVDSKKELDGLWERLTKNTKELEPKPICDTVCQFIDEN